MRLVASLVDFAWMFDFLDDVKLDFDFLLVGRATMPTDLACLFVIVFCIWLGWLGKLDAGNLEIVGLVIGGMRSQK